MQIRTMYYLHILSLTVINVFAAGHVVQPFGVELRLGDDGERKEGQQHERLDALRMFEPAERGAQFFRSARASAALLSLISPAMARDTFPFISPPAATAKPPPSPRALTASAISRALSPITVTLCESCPTVCAIAPPPIQNRARTRARSHRSRGGAPYST